MYNKYPTAALSSICNLLLCYSFIWLCSHSRGNCVLQRLPITLPCPTPLVRQWTGDKAISSTPANSLIGMQLVCRFQRRKIWENLISGRSMQMQLFKQTHSHDHCLSCPFQRGWKPFSRSLPSLPVTSSLQENYKVVRAKMLFLFFFFYTSVEEKVKQIYNFEVQDNSSF